mgnify:CR=1 FL=1
MATYRIESTDYIRIKKAEKTITLLKNEKFESFNQDILGLGKIETKSSQINALSVLFDLEGFTNFCKQIDPQLAVPEFLSEFLNWLFEQIRAELVIEKHATGYELYSGLPFLSKFMGDGVLFLWDTTNLSDIAIQNIVVSMHNICTDYVKVFYKQITEKIVSPPAKLRCGIARGAIYSVGNGNDFVGPCINMSARLQKLNSLTFCFSRRGINPNANEFLMNEFITMKVDIRGIGSNELVCLLKEEYKTLSKEDKAKFSKP